MVTNMAAPFGLLTPDIDGLEIPSLQVLDVNLTGTIYGIKIFLHHIQRLNPTSQIDGKVKARIVITGSEGGFYPLPSDPVYTSSKHGVSDYSNFVIIHRSTISDIHSLLD